MTAAYNDRHAIVGKLVDARADVNTQENIMIGGCALPRRPVRRRSVGGGRLRRAPSGRDTALHWAAFNGYTKSAVALLVGGADQTITDKYG